MKGCEIKSVFFSSFITMNYALLYKNTLGKIEIFFLLLLLLLFVTYITHIISYNIMWVFPHVTHPTLKRIRAVIFLIFIQLYDAQCNNNNL